MFHTLTHAASAVFNVFMTAFIRLLAFLTKTISVDTSSVVTSFTLATILNYKGMKINIAMLFFQSTI